MLACFAGIAGTEFQVVSHDFSLHLELVFVSDKPKGTVKTKPIPNYELRIGFATLYLTLTILYVAD